MIILDFLWDENSLAEDLEMDIPNEDESLFEMSYFVMPIRFNVNGNELFENCGSPWASGPILSLASSGLIAVKDVLKTKKENYLIIDGPGSLEFTLMDNKKVEVAFVISSKRIAEIANHEDLLEAFQKFADKARMFLKERVPQLNEHPYWGPWLRGEKD